MNYQHFRSENNFRGGGSLRQIDSSPGHSSDSGGMFRQMGGIGGGRFDSNDLGLVSPLSGQKRGYPFSGRERSPGEPKLCIFGLVVLYMVMFMVVCF